MKTYQPTDKNIEKFLSESNKIEQSYTRSALVDALYAWEFLKSQDKLTITNIKYTHALLMRFLFPEIAGSFRNEDVRVGNSFCPPWSTVPGLMFGWLEDYGKAKTEGDILSAHIDFERIHPFRDGNGRVGRIIMNWQRIKAGLPIFIIHEGKEQMAYYYLFK